MSKKVVLKDFKQVKKKEKQREKPVKVGLSPLPSLDEQKRIVAKLEKILPLYDMLRKKSPNY